mmetsp:Transcript_10998/g.28695  ORF Transcript_10998/g.28695 Transcript_10998/m.28695 type:complete len:417 (-) Transcript_10998:57-1307(-)
MMEITYKDFRQFMRLLTKETQLWTEMWVDNTLIHSERVDGFLDFGQNEHPIVCQLGGSSPETLAKAAKIVESWGYDEINLNCGCPSDRVAGHGDFGASLMLKPELVRDCMRGIREAAALPVTVKCRLGVDDHDSPEFTAAFVRTVAEAGVRHFIIHARKCLLCGLSPDQNRRIPPLMYDRVFRLCLEFPDLEFTLNGGVNSLEEVESILGSAPPNLVGVMIGRAAYNNPCLLADADRRLYGAEANPESARSRHALLTAYCEYLDREHPASSTDSTGAGAIQGALKPVLGVFHGSPGNKIMRQGINAFSHDKGIRAKGPAAVLRRVMEALEADPKARACLHEPLQRPPSDGASVSGDASVFGDAAEGASAEAEASLVPRPPAEAPAELEAEEAALGPAAVERGPMADALATAAVAAH